MGSIRKYLLFFIYSFPVFGFSQTQDSILQNNKFRIQQGGEIRIQYFHFDNQNWEKGNNSNYLLSRFLWHSSLQIGKNNEFKVELQSGLANGLPSPVSPVDENILDLHQAYYQFSKKNANGSTFSTRIGRQELKYGSQRIISVREGPNNRQSFDALKLAYKQTNWSVDAFLSTYVKAKTGFFNDKFLNKENIVWGVYGTLNKLPVIANADIYYLGIRRAEETFNLAKRKTEKHSLGLRVWRTDQPFSYDIEALIQRGSAASEERINSSTASINTSYKFENSHWTPTLGLKLQYISGDKDSTDQQLNTFDPLYPKGAYFGLSPIIGPKNLTNLHFYSIVNPIKKLNITLEYIHFWRNSTQDAVYDVGGSTLIPAIGQSSRSIGSQFQLSPQYQWKENLHLMADFAYFKKGLFLKQSDAVDLFSAAIGVQFSF